MSDSERVAIAGVTGYIGGLCVVKTKRPPSFRYKSRCSLFFGIELTLHGAVFDC